MNSALDKTDYAADDGANGRMFLTVDEVCQQLGLRKSRVYELAASGLLPVVRLGRRIRFPRRGIESLSDEAIGRAKALLESAPSSGGRAYD